LADHIIVHLQPKKKKNISRDAFGSKLGRVHMKKQDVRKNLQLRKYKALKKDRSMKKSTTPSVTTSTATS